MNTFAAARNRTLGSPVVRFTSPALVALAAWLLAPAPARAAAPACTLTQMSSILRPATPDASAVDVSCSFTYPSHPEIYMPAATPYPGYITRQLNSRGAAARELTFDCKGHTIHPTIAPSAPAIAVTSVNNGDGTWSQPWAVTIQNCVVEGSIRVNGGDDSAAAYTQEGYTAVAQGTAPGQINFVGITQIVDRANTNDAFYLGPGVIYSNLTDSELKGSVTGVPIYVTHESKGNFFARNYIHVVTDDREQVALDGSAENEFRANRFSALNHGGIFIYRNCGEGGVIRHQKPLSNRIVNNLFYYDRFDGSVPAVWVGSRMRSFGGSLFNAKDYCGLDAGYPFGSSNDDTDNAAYTVVAQNQIQSPDSSLTPAKMFRGPLALDTGSQPYFLLDNNQNGSSLVSQPTGCLVFTNRNTDKPSFVYDGDFAVTGTATRASKFTCHDGDFDYSNGVTGTPVISQFECSREGSDAGCSKVVSCPSGQKLVAVRAACHLETSTGVALSTVQAQSWSTLQVVRASDVVSDGLCAVDEVRAQSLGTVSLTPVRYARSSVVASCHEHDANGGDCEVLGEAACF